VVGILLGRSDCSGAQLVGLSLCWRACLAGMVECFTHLVAPGEAVLQLAASRPVIQRGPAMFIRGLRPICSCSSLALRLDFFQVINPVIRCARAFDLLQAKPDAASHLLSGPPCLTGSGGQACQGIALPAQVCRMAFAQGNRRGDCSSSRRPLCSRCAASSVSIPAGVRARRLRCFRRAGNVAIRPKPMPFPGK